MKVLLSLLVATMILSACSSAPEKSGPSQADYERQQNASDKAMRELDRETRQ